MPDQKPQALCFYHKTKYPHPNRLLHTQILEPSAGFRIDAEEENSVHSLTLLKKNKKKYKETFLAKERG